MRYVLVLALLVTGCGTSRPYSQFYRANDPCIRCGEQFENEALVRAARGEVW
jgi:uncharacterized protein (DUF983 family)